MSRSTTPPAPVHLPLGRELCVHQLENRSLRRAARPSIGTHCLLMCSKCVAPGNQQSARSLAILTRPSTTRSRQRPTHTVLPYHVDARAFPGYQPHRPMQPQHSRPTTSLLGFYTQRGESSVSTYLLTTLLTATAAIPDGPPSPQASPWSVRPHRNAGLAASDHSGDSGALHDRPQSRHLQYRLRRPSPTRPRRRNGRPSPPFSAGSGDQFRPGSRRPG